LPDTAAADTADRSTDSATDSTTDQRADRATERHLGYRLQLGAGSRAGQNAREVRPGGEARLRSTSAVLPLGLGGGGEVKADRVRRVRGPRLRPRDRVRVVSPASFPSAEWAEQVMETLAGWGLRPEPGKHALDRRGFMAGSDEDRLADLNDALRDPGVRAVVAATGGAGAYRIVDGLDLAAVRADPKPVVGFSDLTNLHIALWAATGLAGVHGCVGTGGRTDESCRRLLFETEPITLHAEPSSVTVPGRATGVLVGGCAGAVGNFLGAGLPHLDGAILCLEGPQNPHFDFPSVSEPSSTPLRPCCQSAESPRR